MKIVYLIDDFPPDKWSSPGILTFNLAKQLISKGHQVSVITVVQRFASVGESDYHGIKVYRLYANYHVRWRAYLSLYNPQVVSKVKNDFTGS